VGVRPEALCRLLRRVEERPGLLEDVESVVDEWLEGGLLASSVLVSSLALLVGAGEAKVLADLLLKSDVNGLLGFMESSCGGSRAAVVFRSFVARNRVKVQGALLRHALPRLVVGLRVVVDDDLDALYLHLYATLMNGEHVHMILSESDAAKIVRAVARHRPSLLKRALEGLEELEPEDEEADAMGRQGLVDSKLGRIFQ